jgi:hypothetical protein
VFVFGSVHIGAEFVGGRPQGFLDVFDHALFAKSVGFPIAP